MIDISINKILTLVTGLSVASLSMLQVSPSVRPGEDVETTIRTALQTFISAGDNRDVQILEKVLHPEFRVVANQLMGASTLSVMTREQYLVKIQEGKLGGDTRTLEILSIEWVHKNASVHVRLKGKSLSFDTFYHLVQNAEGQWQLIQDLPFITKN